MVTIVSSGAARVTSSRYSNGYIARALPLALNSLTLPAFFFVSMTKSPESPCASTKSESPSACSTTWLESSPASFSISLSAPARILMCASKVIFGSLGGTPPRSRSGILKLRLLSPTNSKSSLLSFSSIEIVSCSSARARASTLPKSSRLMPRLAPSSAENFSKASFGRLKSTIAICEGSMLRKCMPLALTSKVPSSTRLLTASMQDLKNLASLTTSCIAINFHRIEYCGTRLLKGNFGGCLTRMGSLAGSEKLLAALGFVELHEEEELEETHEGNAVDDDALECLGRDGRKAGLLVDADVVVALGEVKRVSAVSEFRKRAVHDEAVEPRLGVKDNHVVSGVKRVGGALVDD